MHSEQRRQFYPMKVREHLSKTHRIPKELHDAIFGVLEAAAFELFVWRDYEDRRKDNSKNLQRLKLNVGQIEKKLAEIEGEIVAHFLQGEAEALGIPRGETTDAALKKFDPLHSPNKQFESMEEYLASKTKLLAFFDRMSKNNLMPTHGTKPDIGLTLWSAKAKSVWNDQLGRAGFSPQLQHGEPSNAVTHFVCEILSPIDPEIEPKTIANHMREAQELQRFQRQ